MNKYLSKANIQMANSIWKIVISTYKESTGQKNSETPPYSYENDTKKGCCLRYG